KCLRQSRSFKSVAETLVLGCPAAYAMRQETCWAGRTSSAQCQHLRAPPRENWTHRVGNVPWSDMGAFLKMWWMFWWRISVVACYFGYNAAGPGFVISGMVAAIIAFEAKKTIVIFPIIRQFYGYAAIAY